MWGKTNRVGIAPSAVAFCFTHAVDRRAFRHRRMPPTVRLDRSRVFISFLFSIQSIGIFHQSVLTLLPSTRPIDDPSIRSILPIDLCVARAASPVVPEHVRTTWTRNSSITAITRASARSSPRARVRRSLRSRPPYVNISPMVPQLTMILQGIFGKTSSLPLE